MTCRNLSQGRSRSRTGSVGNREWRGFTLACFGLLAAGLVAATPALFAAAPALGSGPIDEKKAEAQQVYDKIQALGESLSAADERVNLANIKLQQVAYQQKVNRRELRVAKANLAQGRKLIVQRVRTLYTTPQTSSLDLILGATSLSDLMTRLDDSNRLSSIDNKLIDEVYRFQSSARRHARILAHDHSYAASLLASRQAARTEINDELGEQHRLESQIQGEISTLEAQAAQRRLQEAQEAQQAEQAAQAAQARAAEDTVVGASASTPEGATVVPSSSVGSSVVSIAMSYIGVPYVWGGSTPYGFDCSGLVMYSFARLGISLPHSTYAQWNYGESVPYDQLQPGDLVFFDSLGHVGIYIGGGEYVDAPYTGVDVRVDSMGSGWAQEHYSGARRIT